MSNSDKCNISMNKVHMYVHACITVWRSFNVHIIIHSILMFYHTNNYNYDQLYTGTQDHCPNGWVIWTKQLRNGNLINVLFK